jgi:tetratricopeptide (TPR) repeat protein
MSEIHPELIERYQILLEKDPKSQVFAPLSEAYRKMGLIDEAFRISTRGVQFHPHFAGGHIALANVLMAKGQYGAAKEALEKATSLSPENILAYQQLGECCLRLRQGKEALKAFKMVLLFSPNHHRAQKAVQKLETLTADEFDEDVFKMDRLTSLAREPQAHGGGSELEVLRPKEGQKQMIARDLERQLSLLEAYLVRGQLAEAGELAESLRERFPGNQMVSKRLEALSRTSQKPQAPPVPMEASTSESPELKRYQWLREEKIKFLENLLHRIRENHDPSESLV